MAENLKRPRDLPSTGAIPPSAVLLCNKQDKLKRHTSWFTWCTIQEKLVETIVKADLVLLLMHFCFTDDTVSDEATKRAKLETEQLEADMVAAIKKVEVWKIRFAVYIVWKYWTSYSLLAWIREES